MYWHDAQEPHGAQEPQEPQELHAGTATGAYVGTHAGAHVGAHSGAAHSGAKGGAYVVTDGGAVPNRQSRIRPARLVAGIASIAVTTPHATVRLWMGRRNMI
jgi:hypothetical protein